MFKFDFDIEDDSTEDTKDQTQDEVAQPEESTTDTRPFIEHPLTDLLDKLPDGISYSSVQVGDTHIPRRDLFDVRLQLMASEAQNEAPAEGENQAAIEFATRPSDLVPRVYEGGMKTWECSLDLADYVIGRSGVGELRGKRILEIGCGTAIPTLAVLQRLFDSPVTSNMQGTEIHVQDYNASVLEYVTLPNIILVWFFSKAGESYRSTLPPPSPKPATKAKLPDISNMSLESVPEEDEDEDESTNPPEEHPQPTDPHVFDPKEPGDISLSPALRSAFLASLAEHRIKIRLFSGPWDGFDVKALLGGSAYDLVLTSETVYQPSSLPALVHLLRKSTSPTGICLVAAKLVYFGVGGGIQEFERALKDGQGSMQIVWEQRDGVGRTILQVKFT